MNADQMVTLSLEGSLSFLILVIAYKIYRAKIRSHSGCCSDSGLNGITLDTQNSSVSNENDVLNKL